MVQNRGFVVTPVFERIRKDGHVAKLAGIAVFKPKDRREPLLPVHNFTFTIFDWCKKMAGKVKWFSPTTGVIRSLVNSA